MDVAAAESRREGDTTSGDGRERRRSAAADSLRVFGFLDEDLLVVMTDGGKRPGRISNVGSLETTVALDNFPSTKEDGGNIKPGMLSMSSSLLNSNEWRADG